MVTTWNKLPNNSSIGTELVTNGGFSGSASGWTLNSGWVYATNKVSHTGTNTSFLQSLTISPGTTYRVSLNVLATDGSTSLGITLGGTDIIGVSTVGVHTQDVIAGSADSNIEIAAFDTWSITDVSVRLNSSSWTNVPTPSPLSWTDISKASGTSYTNLPKPAIPFLTGGVPIGMLLALTYAGNTGFLWTPVPYGSGTLWTDVPKAT